MKNRFFKTFTTAVCAVFLSAACLAASGGCGTDLHKATVAAGSIAASLKTAEDVNHANGALETPAEQTAVATYIEQAAVANDNFIGVLQQAAAGSGSVTSATVVNAFSKLVSQISQLNSSGIVKISNPQAQADFNTVIAAVQAQLAILQSIIGTGVTTPQPLPQPPSTPATVSQSRTSLKLLVSGLTTMGAVGIVLSADEVDELIAIATAAASTLLPKLLALKGETDPEILTGALGDDAATIEEAEQDGAPAPAPGSDPNAPVAEAAEQETAEEESSSTSS